MPKQKSPFPERAIDRSVQNFPQISGVASDFGNVSYTLFISSVADRITPWGLNPSRRDIELRQFYPTEDMLAAAVGSVITRNAAFEWKIEGPKLTREASTFMLNSALSGSTQGWIPFISQISTDIETQDNGCFIELIRNGNDPTSPVVGIGHLDAGRCTRTGNPRYPVIYKDRKGNLHKLAWYQVIPISDLPSPVEDMHGIGMCAVSRVLRMAQILKDLHVYKHEKVSGRFERAIHVIGGVNRKEIEDLQAGKHEEDDNKGLTRFTLPLLLTSLDPEKPVSHVEIPLASLPDGFDLDIEMKWYISTLALGFGVDYQDFAPLPGGNLGSSAQSEILHRKSRGKGPALFMALLRNVFNHWGVIPRTCKFLFEEQDIAADVERAKLREIRARERALRLRSGEISPEVARRIAVEADDLSEEELEELKMFDEQKKKEEIDRMMRSAKPVKSGESVGANQDAAGDDTMPDKLRGQNRQDGYLSNKKQ